VFSPDGWGEGEQAGFALSAWMGFVVMLLLGLVPWLPKHISKALPMYIGNIGNAQLFDSWRAAAETFMSGWSSQLHLRSTLGVLAWPSYVALVVSIFMVGVICFTTGLVAFTFAFTLGIIGSLFGFATFVASLWSIGAAVLYNKQSDGT